MKASIGLSKKIKIIYIPNKLNKNKIETCIESSKGIKNIAFYLQKSGMFPSGIDDSKYAIIVSGKVVSSQSFLPHDATQIIITPKVKDIVSAVIAVVKAIWTFALAHPYQFWFAALATSYSIYSAIATRARTPNFGLSNSYGLDEGSATYGWDGIKTLRDVGVPVPIVYGTHRVGGNVINEFIRTDGDKNYLHMLILLAEGEIESISDIELNGNPISNYDNVTVTERYGTNNQTVIPNFEDLHNLYTVNVELTKNNPYIYTTTNIDTEAFEVHIQFPEGLFQQDATTGALKTWSIVIKVEYKLSTDVSYTTLGTYTVTDKTRSQLRRIFRKVGLTAGTYDIKVTKTSNDADLQHTGSAYLQRVDEIKTGDIAYVNSALASIEIQATEQLSGSEPNITFLLKAKKISVPYVTYGGSPVDWEDYYWDPSGSTFKRFSDDAACAWDGSTFHTIFSANPIWCIKDLLVNNRYGLGQYILEENFDDDTLIEMAKYCEERVGDGNGGYEKRFQMDVVIDSFNKALDLINQLSITFNGFPYFSEGAVKMKIDKEQPETTQEFGMGNIIANEFVQSWKSLKEVPNIVEVTYNDAEKNYEQEIVSVEDGDSLANGDPVRKIGVRVFCTRTSQAIRIGRYALKVGKYIDRTVRFKASIDAILCQVGDRIDISHDVPAWGQSGRLGSGSTTSHLVLGREVTLEPGYTYEVMVRYGADIIETVEINETDGSYTEIDLSSTLSSAPEEGAVFAVGIQNILTKPFRLISIDRMNNNEAELVAIEYNENVYDDTDVILPENNYSVLSNVLQIVENLEISEMIVKANDGTLLNTIEVWFKLPEMASYRLKAYDKAKIYLSDDGGTTWRYQGETRGRHFILTDSIETGETYYIAVTSVSKEGDETALSASPQESITILGKQAKPSDVENFDVSQNGNVLRFVCDKIPDGDFSHFIIKKGSEWSTGQTIVERADLSEFEYPVGTIGEQTYMIKAVDTSGNESENASSDTLTVTTPPDASFTQQIDPWTQGREYKLSNIDRVQRNMYDPLYTRDVFVLKTTDTFGDIDGQDWNNLDIGSKGFETSGYLEQAEPIDLETIFEFKITSDLRFNNVAGGSITLQIATSEDNITWSSFSNVSASTNYRARYIKFKYVFASNGTDQVFFYAGTIYVNAANIKLDYGRDIAIDAGGTVITFRDDFTETPRVTGLAVKNGILGIPQITAISASQMTVKVYDPVGASYIGSAEIDWEVKGS